MKETLQRIISESTQGRDLMLVTVVADQGSAPRGAGAWMLLSAAGRLLGSVGGGPVEYRSMQLSQRLLTEKRGELRSFVLHPNDSEDIGMVCGGDVSVLFSFIPARDPQWLAVAQSALDELAAGRTCRLRESLSGGAPALLTADDPAPVLDADSFVRTLSPHLRVVVFGGGHISQQLVPLLSGLDFRLTVYEDRADYARPELFPTAERVLCAPYGEIAAHLSLTAADYVIIMTHGHSHDCEVQQQVMQGQCAYLGVIGSRTKIESINQRLRAAGITDAALATVHTPIGLPIRAVTPAEIAVSIAAELIQVRAEQRSEQPAFIHSHV